MTAFIAKDKDKAPPPDSHKEGDGVDRCPWDGCIETESQYRYGGVDGKGEEYADGFLYSADVRKGGCGAPWTRTTRQGVERDEKKNVQSKWATKSAQTGRFMLMTTSERYRSNYEKIDWSK